MRAIGRKIRIEQARTRGDCAKMKIQIDEDIYSGSAVEIMEQLRQRVFDTGDFPDVETYLWYLHQNYERMTGLRCEVPKGNLELQSRAMFYSLAEIGALQLLEEAENE